MGKGEGGPKSGSNAGGSGHPSERKIRKLGGKLCPVIPGGIGYSQFAGKARKFNNLKKKKKYPNLRP